MITHTCPWWMGYVLINPLRYLRQNPVKILNEYVKEGMTVMDVGPGMGFFTLPLARMVGEKGKAICVDIQDKMLQRLLKRAGKAGLVDRIETRICTQDSLGIDDLAGKIDFILAFAVVHEAANRETFIAEICRALRPGGRLLISEPRAHVPPEMFAETKATALNCGLEEKSSPTIWGSLSVLLGKK